MAFDNIAAICLGFMIVPFLAHIFVLLSQYRNLDDANYRQTVLSVRSAIFLPGYALLMWISIIEPDTFYAMTVLINLVEGYSFYAFFSLLLFNFGGADAAVDTMVKESKEYFLCSCCFPTGDKVKFYSRTSWVMFHMLVTRVLLSIAGAVAYYSDTPIGNVVALVFQVINAVIVLTMVVHVVNFYETMYEHAKNLFGLTKLLLLKCSVGLIVLEGLIANFLISSGRSPYSSDDGDDRYDTEEKTQRGYCALVLLELVVLSILYMYSFGVVKIQPSTAPGIDNNANVGGGGKSLCAFYIDTYRLLDVFGTHKLTTDHHTTPLVAAASV